jgi:methionyl aminopeptidase
MNVPLPMLDFTMIGRNDPCWCGSGKKWKKCHFPELSVMSDENKLADRYYKQYKILLKTPAQIERIRRACQLTAEILEKVCKMAKVGVTTNQLDAYAEKLLKEAGAQSASLGYGNPPFPKSICTSLNDEICHGIPDDLPLKEGDIMNIDLSLILDGYYGDSSQMVMIGDLPIEKYQICNVAYESLHRAIKILKPGILLREIGETIEAYATAQGCSVVNQFVGHGIGASLHEPPQIPHYSNNLAIPLVPGMTFTIEPMINAGKREAVIDPNNLWEARTIDGRPSAQWEHTLLITESGYEILTLPTALSLAPSARSL